MEDNMYKISRKPFAEIKKEKCTDCIHEKNGECTKYDFQFRNVAIIDTLFVNIMYISKII